MITHRDNVAFYEQVWANPRTINPDRLSKSGRKPVFEGVVGSRTLSDGSREARPLSLPWEHAQPRDADGVPAQGANS